MTSYGTNREAFAPVDWALFVYLGLIWGSSFLFMAIGLEAFHPGLVTWLRVGFGAAVLVLVPRVHRDKVDREDWGRVIVIAFTWIAIPFTLFPIAQQWINSAVTGMLNGATPIFTAVIATLVFKSKPGRLQTMGLVLGFAGMVAIALPSAGEGGSQALGVALVLVATILYAISLNMLPALQQRYGALPVIGRAQFIAALLVTPFGIYGLGRSTYAVESLLAMLAVGILGTGMALVFMATLSGRVGATRAAFITYLIPVVAMVLGVIFRDDVVSPIAIVGVVLVIAGALLASRRET